MSQSTIPNIVDLTSLAEKNVRSIICGAIEHVSPENALVIFDNQNELTQILTEAYRRVLPHAVFINFDETENDSVIDAINLLNPRDLVVLIQSTDFRLNAFRIRIYLFQRKLKVIDHLHLSRNIASSWKTYINSLEYDSEWYRGTGKALKKRLESTNTFCIKYRDSTLKVEGGLEVPKLNIGDYSGMENIGGTFPIGEVFTEAKDFIQMNGSFYVYAFADSTYNVTMHEPFRVDVEKGLVVSWGDNAPQTFTDVVAQVKSNERALIREIGFGLNRAFTRENYVNDITAFERILGLHLSLGEKHTVYKKAGIVADKTRFHVDLFISFNEITSDGNILSKDKIFYINNKKGLQMET
ncbi:MAG: hypothetical protein K9M10_01005 [Candidatus Pacebacteria bacterium]|nr:hypothetical protein [Candidatus Paceibacterota bacterium]MCF7857041.1 hypothetical protein [Candidatus Paceibacterota bacterium]